MAGLLPAGGCTFAADPAQDCAQARYLWAADADPWVLRARVRIASGGNSAAIELAGFPICVWQQGSWLHVRLDLPDGVLRLDVVEGNLDGGFVEIEPALDLSRALDPQLATVRRVKALLDGGIGGRPGQRLVHLVETLRTADALAAGASLREIGLGMFGGDWPGDGEHLKSRVRRRVVLVDELLRAGPRGVLAGSI